MSIDLHVLSNKPNFSPPAGQQCPQEHRVHLLAKSSSDIDQLGQHALGEA